MMRYTVVLLFLILHISSTLYGQQPMLNNHKRFTVDEGLPQNFISGITQDDDGFIWFSTLDGLCRYDGKNFRIFQSHINDRTSISSNAIYSLITRKNNILTLLYNGLPADDFNARTFKVSPNKVRYIVDSLDDARWHTSRAENHHTENWLFLMNGYKGVGWYEAGTRKIHLANKANGLLKQDTVCAIVESPGGKLYLVSEDGVQVSNPSKTVFEFIRFKTPIKKLPENIYKTTYHKEYSIAWLSEDEIALLDSDHVYVLNIAHRSVVQHRVPPPGKPTIETVNPLLKKDRQGRLYFGHHGRIFRIESDGKLQLLWENTFAPHLTISSYFIDGSDVLWVSISAQGIFKVDLTSPPFKSYKYVQGSNFIYDILESSGVPLQWIPSQWRNVHAPYNLRQGTDSKGNLIFCNSSPVRVGGELFQLSKSGSLKIFRHHPGVAAYAALMILPNDAIWAYDQIYNRWYCWENPESMYTTLQPEYEEMAKAEIADAKFIGGSIWISTYASGLLQYKGSRLIKRHTISDQKTGDLTEICPDPLNPDKFWVGTRGGGLLLWNIHTGLEKIYTTADGLPNNTIYCILPDMSNRLWASTNKGIFCFDPRSKKVLHHFEKHDGLQGNEFNRAHKFILANHTFAFGGVDGFTVFNPLSFTSDRKPSSVPVQITSIQINNDEHEPGSKWITEPLSLLQKIELPYSANNLRFEFAALEFNQPQKTKYRYMLYGADAHWIDNHTNNTASFASLSPGHYKLLINATDLSGNWSAHIRELQIIINPPVWMTWWAIFIYILALLALIYTYVKYRESKVHILQNLAFEKKEALRLKELDELKDRFFSNITHEFRTPLTLIVSPLNKLLNDRSVPPHVTRSLKRIEKSAQQLLRLINQLLDFAKINDGRMTLNLSAGDFALFATGCIQRFESMAADKQIQLDFACEGVAGHYFFDEEKWEKIMMNLVSNSIKFSPDGGQVSILVSAPQSEILRFEITDNGCGIPHDQQKKIFDRFYQAEQSSHHPGGSGIGLAMVKELVELMNGRIDLVSAPGLYTRFVVEIPTRKCIAQEGFTSKQAHLADVSDQQNKPVILVVEDNEELRHFIVECLSIDYRVLAAVDGADAWKCILQELPDVVVSDIIMPEMNGFELCHLCKSDIRTAHIGMILLTTKAAHEARIEGLQSGADEYITKPFHFDELELRIANLIQLQNHLREHLQSRLMPTEPDKLAVPTDPFLQKLYSELDDHLDDPQLGVDYLCDVLAMSRSTLNRKLKSLLDATPNDIIRKYRLNKAAQLLISGENIAGVVYKVGFSSHSYFTQCFREQYGITPTEYVTGRS